jgi:hypothetical protein
LTKPADPELIVATLKAVLKASEPVTSDAAAQLYERAGIVGDNRAAHDSSSP